jgi:uncharacterized protein YecE (DUF72 family)
MLSKLQIPEQYRPYLRIGTCSWKYDSWKELVYETDKYYGPYDYLADYARFFNTVEIDQWFWSLFPKGAKLPDIETVRRYADSVPDDFIFTVKAPNSITLTNYYAKQTPAFKAFAGRTNPFFLDVELLCRFLETLEPMRSRLGPIMFQFEYLNRKKMPSKEAFLERLDEFFEQAPKGYDYAVETRNKNYLTEDFFEFLRKRGLGFVLLEGYYMPHIAEITAKQDVRTAEFSIVRLHGPDRQEIEERAGGQWTKVIEPKDEGLKETASIIEENTRRKLMTFVNVNNHYEGCAPLTIRRLLEGLKLSGTLFNE